MKRTITVFGILAGLIVAATMILSLSLFSDGQCHSSPYAMVIGYTSMLLAFSLIFVAVKTQRDKRQGGQISFKSAFLIGLGIAAIGSACYTVTWVIVYKNFFPSFLEDYVSAHLAAMSRSGASAAAIAAERAEYQEMLATYHTWPGLIGYTLMEILPVGLLVALVAALVLKRSNRRPALA